MAPSKIGKYDFTTLPFAIPMLQFMTYTMPSIAFLYAAVSYHADYLQHLSMDLLDWNHIEEFDFIIGSGSAGSVLANRLSKNNQVLLLEAGGEPSPLAQIPGFAIYLQHVHGVDWEYYTVPQRNACLAMKENRSFWPRGYSLGGSSNLNFMIYERGNPKDYHAWTQATDNEEWSYENTLPFFKKSEDYHGFYMKKNDKFHSQGGPLYVGKVFTDDDRHNLANYFVQAGVEMGHEHHDTNGYQHQGFGYLDVTIKNGERWGTYSAFLKPVMKRRNLYIYRYSRVIKIHLDRRKTAYGVSFIRHGVQKFVRARKEVIISAGAIESPKLLMLSGIGLKPHLHSVGLKCRAHLPVGKNLQDHVLAMIGPFTINKTMSAIIERDSSLYNIREYFGGKGPLATPSAISAVGYFASSLAPSRNWPDVQYLMAGLGVSPIMAKDLSYILGYKQGYLEKFYEPNKGKDAFFVFTTLGKPRTTGEILLKSSDPWEKPLIDPKYYSHPDDIKIMVEGFRFLVDMIENTKMYSQINAKFARNHVPGCEMFPTKSDEYYECYLRHNTLTLYHPSSTCPMGKSHNDSRAVVDSELRVLKTKRLRVIDASIMPTIPNANLNAPTIMTAEKGAFFIMNYWAQQYEVCVLLEYFLFLDGDRCYYSQLP